MACGGGSSGGDGQVAVKTVGLEEAFAATSKATSYRITQASGQTISSTAMGIDTKTEIDPEHPTVSGEVTADRSHLVLDLSTIFEPMVGADMPPLTVEMWTEPDRLVIDSRGYAALLAKNPGATLGPMAPGVASIDLAALRADSDLMAALVGQSLPDLKELAERLPGALGSVERQGSRTFTGSTSYANLLTALGSDIDQNAKSAAAGIALNLHVDALALAQLYIDYFRDTAAEVTVELDAAGLVHVITTHVDMAGIFERIFRANSGLDLGVPAPLLADAYARFADTVWTIDSRITFEVDDDLEIEPAPTATEDRTQEWVAFLKSAGV